MGVATKSKIDGEIKSNIGVLQGDPLSCLLFNCFLADLAQEFDGTGPTLQGTRIPCLGYSDDLALMGESIEELKEMLEKLEKFCNVNKLKINTVKTKIIICRKGIGRRIRRRRSSRLRVCPTERGIF